MADKRSIDQMTVAELERILAIKRRQERQTRVQRMKDAGRVIDSNPPTPPPAMPIFNVPMLSPGDTMEVHCSSDAPGAQPPQRRDWARFVQTVSPTTRPVPPWMF